MRLAFAVLLVGCHYSSPGGGDPGQPLDGAPGVDQLVVVDGPVAPGCAVAPGAVVDAFNGVQLCSPWGNPAQSQVAMVEGNARLEIQPITNSLVAGPSHGGCTQGGSEPFEAAGVFVEVAKTLSGTTAYTNLNAYSADAGISGRLVVKNGELALIDNANNAIVHATYNSAAMRWWRLRPDPTGVIADVSADGRAWTQFGLSPGTPPAAIVIDLGAGTDDAESNPGMAEFRNLDICP